MSHYILYSKDTTLKKKKKTKKNSTHKLYYKICYLDMTCSPKEIGLFYKIT